MSEDVGSVAVEEQAGSAREHDGEAPMDDATAGRIFVLGLVVGGLAMTALSFVMGLIAGLDTDIAAAVAPVPGVVAGLFFGSTAYIGIHLARHGH